MQRKREAALMLLALNVLLAGCLERELKPLNPCLVSGVTRSVLAKNIDKLDLLFMVDNSGSMKEEQDALRDQFPKLIQTLTTGDRSARGLSAFPPVTDLHLGVVSSDMGVPGVAGIKGCSPDGGDDGKLRHEPQGAGCAPSYPSFLSFNAKGGNPNAIVQDFACISMLGTMGCGFEQQLEAPFKALWPSVYTDPATGGVAKNPFSFLSTTAAGTLGRGDLPAVQGGSASFLRNDPKTGLSLIAIVVVTDEEDCSARVTDHFKTMPGDLDVNVRCARNPQNLFDVKKRYWQGFRALRPGNEDLVVFAAIVGVPTDLVDETARAAVKFSEASQRDAYYNRILADSRMQEEIVTLPNGELRLRPSCSKPALTPDGDPQTADPPRRIVQLAKEFGENGIVQSICQPQFGAAMDAIIDAIAIHLKPVCLPRPLVRTASGKVSCKVIWELPKAGEAPESSPTDCGQQPTFLKPLEDGKNGKRCEVLQLPVPDKKVPMGVGDGWFYDDFSPERLTECLSTEPQRLSFTATAKPPTGVVVKLECLEETQRLANVRTDLSVSAKQPEIGTACGKNTVAAPGGFEENCVLTLQDGSSDNSMFCHPQTNICVRACVSKTDCPPAWDCDTRPETLAQAGPRGGFCVNPTCGTDTVSDSM
jgi:hypothetical protein